MKTDIEPKEEKAVDRASSPARKDNMPTSDATACTSPLTVGSLDVVATGGRDLSRRRHGGGEDEDEEGGGVPQVVSSVKHQHQQQPSSSSLSSSDPQFAAPPSASSSVAMLGIDYYHCYSTSAAEAEAYYHPNTKNQKIPPTERDYRKLFVGGLPTDVNNDEFFTFFNQYGPVVDSVVMVDRDTKRSRGFGFVTFQYVSDAVRLLTAIPGKTGYVSISGKECEVKASTPKTPGDGPGSSTHRQGGGGGRWRSSPPHHWNNRGYNRAGSSGSSKQREYNRAGSSGSSMQREYNRAGSSGSSMQREYNRAGSSGSSMQREYNRAGSSGSSEQKQQAVPDGLGEVDSRDGNFDYPQRPPQVMTATSYQTPMNAYGCNPTAYHSNYPIAYPTAASIGYVYPGNSPYPAMSQGHGIYYNTLLATKQYGNPPPMMAGHYMEYSTYNTYNNDGEIVGYGSGYEHIPKQPYRDGNEYSASADESD